MALRSNNRARALAVACAAVGFIAASGAVQAQTVATWTVTSAPLVGPETAINFCKQVRTKTARDAVRICLSKVAINLPFEDFAVTAGKVCKTKWKAVSTNGTGYVYANSLARALTPACP
jgi:hypothetical protein